MNLTNVIFTTRQHHRQQLQQLSMTHRRWNSSHQSRVTGNSGSSLVVVIALIYWFASQTISCAINSQTAHHRSLMQPPTVNPHPLPPLLPRVRYQTLQVDFRVVW
jgi:hypothetical protein